jgi:hypothetical protein
MIRNRWLRRSLAAVLIVVGALLLLLAPSVEYGLLAFALGVALEAVGLVVEHRAPR